MKWLEISVKTNSNAVEAISEILTRFGANGVSIEDKSSFDKDFEEINWDYVDEDLISNDETAWVRAYYQEQTDLEKVLGSIDEAVKEAEKYLVIGEYSVETKYVDEENWQNEWKKYYKPIKIGKSILVKPSWEDIEIKDREIVVELDPGMAFGTGTHESTRMCMELIEKYIRYGNKLLDIGCGSGILSILGAKLGCSKIFSIDIDPLSIKTSLENFKINKVENIAFAQKAVIEEINVEKYDVVVANIVANVIIDIAPKVVEFLNEGGIFIASGIIKDRKEEVEKAILDNGFKILEISNMGEWVAIASTCVNSSQKLKI
ncbi:MAG: 50S ribosomal protein L11 methyltransferase [Deltaproteobacteria bacterium]